MIFLPSISISSFSDVNIYVNAKKRKKFIIKVLTDFIRMLRGHFYEAQPSSMDFHLQVSFEHQVRLT